MKKHLLVLIAAAVLIGGFAAAMLLHSSNESNTTQSIVAQNTPSLVRGHSPKAGSAGARVTIVEFFDPACGTCRVFHPIVKKMMRDHPGKISLVVRYMPLHPGSEEVVKILEAARLQGKFWEALDAGYATQRYWAINHQAHPDLFWKSIATVGLDPEQVSSDMRSLAVSQNIKQDIDDGRKLGVNKTPGFYVNGRPLTQFGEKQLYNLVNEELNRAYGS